ncbi:hypothetical protein [Fusobacterium sp.]|uniref:hypothetical protein n=1 Tax=Fusobacterium sp. TaxID=68766 RepID=UPI002E79C8CB|nr:hypothetical protein [Fusobacterium sp.]MEE1476274.1 hypothetical protein [Fusobacterium sp.]
MFFTQEDLNKIYRYIKTKGIKDTEFQKVCSLKGNELIPIIQDNQNVIITLTRLLSSIGITNLLNVTEIGTSSTGKYTLIEAIKEVNPLFRIGGSIITFINSCDDNWKLYHFTGKNKEDWFNLDLWENLLSEKFKGYFYSYELLTNICPIPKIGDYAYVGETLGNSIVYRCVNTGIWSKTGEVFNSASITIEGNITIGENGNWFQNGLDTGIKAQGPKGEDGKGLTILDSYSSIEDLKDQHPVGNIGDAYLVNGILYIWDNALQDWRGSGNIQGPKGEDGKTWKPSVDEGGNLTWTLDNSTTTPVSVNIKGEQGDPFTYEDFEPEQLEALKGEPGSKIYEGDSFPEGPFNNGDIFINTTTFDMYYYADSWNQIGSIKGTAVKIRVSDGHLQYGYEGSESWENIISIQALINQITDKIVLI